MKLTKASIKHNRKFHRLPEDRRLEFLLNAYSQVFPKDESQRGEFTLADVDISRLDKGSNRDERFAERDKLNSNIDRLNFLMTRLNMAGNPQYEEQVRELALLRFEYMFMAGDNELTQDPRLVVDFFRKRGKPELIKPVLSRMGEKATEYEHLAERIIDNPVFKENVGTDTAQYKFRTRLHVLVEDEDFSKEQAAAKLMGEGFDLTANDFNRWYKAEKNLDVKLGDKNYKTSPEEAKWLADFVAQRTGQKTLEGKVGIGKSDEPLVPKDDEEDPCKEYKCSREAVETLDAGVKLTLKEKGDDPNFYWVKELSALTRDYGEISLDRANLIEAKMWNYLWGGQFNDLAHQLKGANPCGRTRKGLNYNKWALMHEEHRKTINPVLAQDSYAMIIAGDILVGDLKDAVEDLNRPELQQYKNPDKIRAAVNLAWEMMQHPGESDGQENSQPPRGFLFHVAKEFNDFLRETPTAAPYITLVNASPETKLNEEEEKILGSVRSLDDVERIYIQLGRSGSIRDRFLQIFDEVYDRYTEHCILSSDVSGIVRTVQNPTFKKYVSNEQVSERLGNSINRTLQRKSEHDPERDEFGTKKMVAAVYNNPILRPYIENRADVGGLVNGMIDDVVGRGRRNSLISEPFSLRGDYEISMGTSDALEAYAIADACRDAADPERMSDLVAYMIGIVADQRHEGEFRLENRFMHMKAKAEGADLNAEAFPAEDSESEHGKFDFLSRVYQREKQLGGIDQQKVQTALTNVLFRANYAVPRRFYPHADAMMAILDSPLEEVLPTEGLGYDSIKEYKILHDFLRR